MPSHANNPLIVVQVLSCLFFAVLFIQSGLDKVFDWKGNLGWMTPHFSKSPLRGAVPLMLGVITLMELAAGFLSAAGLVLLLVSGALWLAFLGVSIAGFALVGLFFGQRMAKDYAGAAALVPYFLAAIAGIASLRG